MKQKLQVKTIPALVVLGCLPLNENLLCPLSPTGLKSQEERQKEEICQFWNCESIRCYLFCILWYKSVQSLNPSMSLSKIKLLSGQRATCLSSRLPCCPSKWSPSTPLWISFVEGEWNINEADLQSVSVAAIEAVSTFACAGICAHCILHFKDWSDF